MSLTTGSGYGAEYAIQYMDKMATIFGFNVAPNLDLNVRPGKVKEDEKQFNEKKAKEAFTFFLARIQEGTKDKPTLNMMVPFGIFKAISVMAKDTMLADYEYYKDKQDFYYNVNIPFFKKWIANKIVKKEVDKILN